MSLGEDYQQTAAPHKGGTPDRGGTSIDLLLNGLAIGNESTSICITLRTSHKDAAGSALGDTNQSVQPPGHSIYSSPSQYTPTGGYIDGSVQEKPATVPIKSPPSSHIWRLKRTQVLIQSSVGKRHPSRTPVQRPFASIKCTSPTRDLLKTSQSQALQTPPCDGGAAANFIAPFSSIARAASETLEPDPTSKTKVEYSYLGTTVIKP